MRDKTLQIRADDDFLAKVEYLRKVNGWRTTSETVRKVVEKEHRKEFQQDDVPWIIDGHHIQCGKCGATMCIKDREGDPIPQNFCPACGSKMRVPEHFT